MTTVADLTAEQVGNAQLIAATVGSLQGDEWDKICAVACALQESSLINLPAGDKDSVGLFQQRPSQGWGTVEQIADPVYATTAFCQGTPNTSAGLFGIPADAGLSMADRIQAVQLSADGSLYAQWQDLATALIGGFIVGSPVPVESIPAYYQGYPGRPDGIDFIVIHSVESPIGLYADSLARYYFGTTACGETSAHAIIDPTVIVEMVPPGSRAWQCGNGNDRGYGIEQSGYARFSRAEWTTAAGLQQLENVAWWAAGKCRELGIAPRWLTDGQLATPGNKGFVTHSDVTRVLGGTTHTDPGDGYPRDLLMAAVQRQLGDVTPTPSPPEDDMTPEQAKQLSDLAAEVALINKRVGLLIQSQAVDADKVSASNAHVAISPYSIPNKLAGIKKQLDALTTGTIGIAKGSDALAVPPYSVFNLAHQTNSGLTDLHAKVDDLAAAVQAVTDGKKL